MTSTDNLKVKARFLRNAAPQAFNDFYGAFVDYTRGATEFLVDVDGNFQLHQGYAKQAVRILRALEEAKNG